jgi:hypothetical protein
MTLIDHLPTVNLRPPARVRPPIRAVAALSSSPGGLDGSRRYGRPEPPTPDLAEADALIADLAALVDAGLVTVRRQLGGPIRYGAVVDLGDAA